MTIPEMDELIDLFRTGGPAAGRGNHGLHFVLPKPIPDKFQFALVPLIRRELSIDDLTDLFSRGFVGPAPRAKIKHWIFDRLYQKATNPYGDSHTCFQTILYDPNGKPFEVGECCSDVPLDAQIRIICRPQWFRRRYGSKEECKLYLGGYADNQQVFYGLDGTSGRFPLRPGTKVPGDVTQPSDVPVFVPAYKHKLAEILSRVRDSQESGTQPESGEPPSLSTQPVRGHPMGSDANRNNSKQTSESGKPADSALDKSAVTPSSTPKPNGLKALLQDFRDQVPPPKAHEPTLLEIAGWKGDEKIASNILAFFLSPVREHGWRTLLLDAFLSLVGWNGPQPDADGVLVTREVKTENGNFLDIVIEAPGVLVIGIENKIAADPYTNPYGDYMKHLESLSRGTGAKPLLTLLIPREVNCPDVRVPIKCVTYGPLFQSVDSRLCDPNIDLNSQYVLRWNEFRQTMQDYSEEAKVDKEFLDFITAHPEDMRDLLKRTEKLRIEMEQEVKASREDARRLLGEKPDFWHFTDELRRPPGQIRREWKYLVFYSYFIDLKIPSILHHVYIGAGLFLGKGWEVQLAEGSPNGRIWEPTNLSAWLLKHDIRTHRSGLMTNFLAYGEGILPQVPESRAAVAKLFSQLIGAVNESLRHPAAR